MTINLRNFEIPQNWVFGFYFDFLKLYMKEAPKYASSIWTCHAMITHVPFLLFNTGIHMQISTYIFVPNEVFLKVPYVSCI